MKICLTTFVAGDVYQDYIPMAVYSIGKAYPDYDIILFVHGKLRKDVRECLDVIRERYDRFRIEEDAFADCPRMDNLIARCLRWVLWDEAFLQYDYLYTIDLDMFYLREPQGLLEQHIEHMKFIGSDSVSNYRRVAVLKKTPFQLMRIFKWGGLRGVISYLGTRRVYRLSGLHFVKVKEYYQRITPRILKKYKAIIYKNRILRVAPLISCEPLLYEMVREGGTDMSIFATQRSVVSMLDFENPRTREFSPHHGIHFGLFRTDLTQMNGKVNTEVVAQLEHKAYKYYVGVFQREVLTDPLFRKLYPMFSDRLKTYFQRMFRYYRIETPFLEQA